MGASELGLALAVLATAACGLALARLGRRPDVAATLRARGFAPYQGALRGALGGRPLEARLGPELTLSTPLPPRPVPYGRLARALGRGDLLASLHALTAEASLDQLTARLPRTLPPRDLSRRLDELTRLAERLEALPLAEGLARWYLELGEGEDPRAALELVLTAAPDAEETLALCRLELGAQARPDLAERARRHLTSFEDRASRSSNILSPSP